uniref:Uncharacterized protein n=1 Tax=Oryza nivara TaxID=4536 RepID=A0A0E0I1C3_ORYNI
MTTRSQIPFPKFQHPPKQINFARNQKLGKGDTIHTIIKFLSNKLSGHEPTCKRIVAVGTGSSKSESVVAVDKVESMLCNLDRFEANAQHEVGPTTPDCNYSSPGCFNANVKQAAMATLHRREEGAITVVIARSMETRRRRERRMG